MQQIEQLPTEVEQHLSDEQDPEKLMENAIETLTRVSVVDLAWQERLAIILQLKLIGSNVCDYDYFHIFMSYLGDQYTPLCSTNQFQSSETEVSNFINSLISNDIQSDQISRHKQTGLLLPLLRNQFSDGRSSFIKELCEATCSIVETIISGFCIDYYCYMNCLIQVRQEQDIQLNKLNNLNPSPSIIHYISQYTTILSTIIDELMKLLGSTNSIMRDSSSKALYHIFIHLSSLSTLLNLDQSYNHINNKEEQQQQLNQKINSIIGITLSQISQYIKQKQLSGFVKRGGLKIIEQIFQMEYSCECMNNAWKEKINNNQNNNQIQQIEQQQQMDKDNNDQQQNEQIQQQQQSQSQSKQPKKWFTSNPNLIMQSIWLLCEDSDKEVREQSRRCIHSGLLVYDESLIKIDMSELNANANTNIRIWRSIEQEQESPKVHLKIQEGLKEIKKNQIEIMNKSAMLIQRKRNMIVKILEEEGQILKENELLDLSDKNDLLDQSDENEQKNQQNCDLNDNQNQDLKGSQLIRYSELIKELRGMFDSDIQEQFEQTFKDEIITLKVKEGLLKDTTSSQQSNNSVKDSSSNKRMKQGWKLPQSRFNQKKDDEQDQNEQNMNKQENRQQMSIEDNNQYNNKQQEQINNSLNEQEQQQEQQQSINEYNKQTLKEENIQLISSLLPPSAYDKFTETEKLELKMKEKIKQGNKQQIINTPRFKQNELKIQQKTDNYNNGGITRHTKASLGKSKSKRITNGDDGSGLKLNDLLGQGSMVPVKRKRYIDIDIDIDEQQQQVIQDEQVEDKDAIRRKRIKKDEE